MSNLGTWITKNGIKPRKLSGFAWTWGFTLNRWRCVVRIVVPKQDSKDMMDIRFSTDSCRSPMTVTQLFGTELRGYLCKTEGFHRIHPFNQGWRWCCNVAPTVVPQLNLPLPLRASPSERFCRHVVVTSQKNWATHPSFDHGTHDCKPYL